MRKLNSLDNPVTGLDGEPIIVGGTLEKPVYETVGRMMANVLARAQSEDAVRAWMLAQEIYKAKTLDIEDADFALVQEAVDGDKMLTNLGRAALLTALNGAKDKE